MCNKSGGAGSLNFVFYLAESGSPCLEVTFYDTLLASGGIFSLEGSFSLGP